MKVAKAVKILTKALSKDNGLYDGYQANIAMAFIDEYNKCGKSYKNQHDIHNIANIAAENFLNLWINNK